ncbi:hypothetical protein K8R30_03025 [archaeon]|nr:hypothetical protein [archaeon]
MVIKSCINCHQEKEHHAKGLCYTCYKKINWKPKIKKCRRCQKPRAIHAKNLCASCYNTTFHLDKARAYNQRKKNNITLVLFRKTTKKCVICGFDKIVNIHHIDANKTNNSPKNLIGLCPNHHRMINNHKFRQEIFTILKQKGYSLPLESTPIPEPENTTTKF